MRLVSLILVVIGWVVILFGAFGAGLSLTIGNLSPLSSGIVLVLAGLSLSVMADR